MQQKTAATQFIPEFVVERTINVIPHIVIRLTCGHFPKGEHLLRAAEITIKNYTENTSTVIPAGKGRAFFNSVSHVLRMEEENSPHNFAQSETFKMSRGKWGIGMESRKGKFLLLTRHNYIVGVGKRCLIAPLREMRNHVETILEFERCWLKREDFDDQNLPGNITSKELFTRTITSFTPEKRIRGTSLVAFLGNDHNGREFVSTSIYTTMGKLALVDYLDGNGGRSDMYKRPVPFILDRLAEGLAFLLDQPGKPSTIAAEPLLPMFTDWKNSNAYVSHTNTGYVIMNCDQYPTYSKAGWKFNYDHLQRLYTAMRELLNNYPHQ